MRIKVQEVGKSVHPKEVIVSVDTKDGAEHLIVHERALKDNTLEIGYPISSTASDYLIELPRETTSGAWRVWVQNSNVLS